MTNSGQLIHLLKNTPVRKIIKALERDNFILRRSTPTGGRIYAHPDGRMTFIHYHYGSDTLTRKTLRTLLEGTHWTDEDIKRLKLVK
jgi:predicted RNA binding protein YcfA (HicA-like mRNA interferase family)